MPKVWSAHELVSLSWEARAQLQRELASDLDHGAPARAFGRERRFMAFVDRCWQSVRAVISALASFVLSRRARHTYDVNQALELLLGKDDEALILRADAREGRRTTDYSKR